jgi:hypothetical protein
MKQPKKRWAITPKQRRRPTARRLWWHNSPPQYFHRLAWKNHRQAEQEALREVLNGNEDAVFPFSHHHWLLWWWS